MTGYVRADTTDNIANNKVINANDLDAEFNAVQAAFNESTGHSHDGSSAEGVPITKVGPAQDIEVTATEALPKTTEVVSLGTTLKKFKDLFLSGTATAVSFVGNLTGNASTATSLETARNITLGGDVTGSTSFDGTSNVTITTTVADDSHTHDVRYYTKTESNAQFDEHPLKTLLISAGEGLTGGGSLEASRTISHADTSSQASVNNLNGTVIQDVTVDGYGHITVLGSVNLDDRYYTESEVDAALGGKVDTSINISAGAGLTGGGSLAFSRTISHADTSSQASVNNSNGTVIQDIILDTYGHVTSLASVNLDTRYALAGEAWPGVYTGSAADNLTFPIGTCLMVDARDRARNSLNTVRLSTVDNTNYTVDGSGSILTGVWRARGDTIFNDHGQLMQRVS